MCILDTTLPKVNSKTDLSEIEADLVSLQSMLQDDLDLNERLRRSEPDLEVVNWDSPTYRLLAVVDELNFELMRDLNAKDLANCLTLASYDIRFPREIRFVVWPSLTDFPLEVRKLSLNVDQN